MPKMRRKTKKDYSVDELSVPSYEEVISQIQKKISVQWQLKSIPERAIKC